MATVRQSAFETALQMTPIAGGKRLWLVDEDLDYYSALLEDVVSVPAGFVTDLNSIPRIFWILSPPTDFPEAGVVHDFLYRYKLVPRKTADAVYREALHVLGAGKVRCFIRYWGLRIGGSHAYNKPTEELR